MIWSGSLLVAKNVIQKLLEHKQLIWAAAYYDFIRSRRWYNLCLIYMIELSRVNIIDWVNIFELSLLFSLCWASVSWGGCIAFHCHCDPREQETLTQCWLDVGPASWVNVSCLLGCGGGGRRCLKDVCLSIWKVARQWWCKSAPNGTHLSREQASQSWRLQPLPSHPVLPWTSLFWPPRTNQFETFIEPADCALYISRPLPSLQAELLWEIPPRYLLPGPLLPQTFSPRCGRNFQIQFDSSSKWFNHCSIFGMATIKILFPNRCYMQLRLVPIISHCRF